MCKFDHIGCTRRNPDHVGSQGPGSSLLRFNRLNLVNQPVVVLLWFCSSALNCAVWCALFIAQFREERHPSMQSGGRGSDRGQVTAGALDPDDADSAAGAASAGSNADDWTMPARTMTGDKNWDKFGQCTILPVTIHRTSTTSGLVSSGSASNSVCCAIPIRTHRHRLHRHQ